MIRFGRRFAMPSADTFSVKPIGNFVWWYLMDSTVSVDPFARNKRWCTHTNDLNPDTAAEHHMDAADFCTSLRDLISADLILFDPPYSPRQISECYKGIGRPVTSQDTQNAALYKRVRDAFDPLVAPGGVVLSFGWSSTGMGKARGYELEEVLLITHGGAHNDTICIAERKL
jgi:hypothetical protein